MSTKKITKEKKLEYKPSLSDKAFAAWLKHDPLVNLLVTRGDEEIRRDVMLQFLGPKATKHYFHYLPKSKYDIGPVIPKSVREQEKNFINNPQSRTKIIKLLIHWATDKNINARYINSHLTRVQIITSFLTSMFLHANHAQTKLILAGIKKIAFLKKFSSHKSGDQSLAVQQNILNKITDILIHNQKTIITKAIGDTQEKMRAELLRSIQTMKGDSIATPYYESNVAKKKPLIKEKFPLSREISKELELLLQAYTQSPWESLRYQAATTQQQLERLRCPISVDT